MQETITQTKICTVCKVEQELCYFHKNKNFKNGINCRCKGCVKEYNEQNKQKIAKTKALWSKRNKDKIAESRKRNSAKNYAKNRESILKKSAEYYKANKEKIAKYQATWRNANKEKTAIYTKTYKKTHKKLHSECQARYQKTIKGRASKKNHEHKRRTVAKEGDVTTNQLSELQSNAKVCYWCNCSLKKVKVHIDHYVPLSKGGEHTLSNLVVCCQRCNNQKHAKDPLEFANSKGRLL